jgi:hypothetical protein
MQADIEECVVCCDSCQRVKVPRHKLQRELTSLDSPERRWHSMSMVLITDFPKTPHSKDAIVVILERLTQTCLLAPKR